MTAVTLRKMLRGRGWLAVALVLSACALSPSPDIPGAMSDGSVPSGTGGLTSATGGSGPCLLLQDPVESWCADDDLWVRDHSCTGDTWTVSPCPEGCVEASESGQAACRTGGLGVGGLGGQSAGAP